MTKRIQVGGEEFEIEDPRAGRARAAAVEAGLADTQTNGYEPRKRKSLLEPKVEDGSADAPPTQEERMDALRALHQMEATVRGMFKKLGGKNGARAVSIAITHLEDAFLRAKDYAATTKAPWR